MYQKKTKGHLTIRNYHLPLVVFRHLATTAKVRKRKRQFSIQMEFWVYSYGMLLFFILLSSLSSIPIRFHFWLLFFKLLYSQNDCDQTYRLNDLLVLYYDTTRLESNFINGKSFLKRNLIFIFIWYRQFLVVAVIIAAVIIVVIILSGNYIGSIIYYIDYEISLFFPLI